MILIKNIGELLHFDETTKEDILKDAFIIIKDGKIFKYGKNEEIPDYKFTEIINARNKVVTPGFIDSHTHLIFSGNRADEFELRNQGATYEEILLKGGGINNTVTSTRKSSFADLLKTGKERLDTALSYGITTIEIKSGYGLDKENEIKILEVIKQLSNFTTQNLIPTYLGAHIVPTEYKNRRKAYIELIKNEMLPLIRKKDLAQNIDIFIENGAFSSQEAEDIIKEAIKYNFKIKLHAQQLSNTESVQLGVKYNALSVDHLEFINDNDIKALKNSNTVAVLLPLAVIFLNNDNYVNAKNLIKEGIKVAIATDFNPGSANSLNINLAMFLSVLKSHMTILDTIKAVTLNAAYALGLQEKTGSLQIGKQADLLIHNTKTYKDLVYKMAHPLVETVFINGQKRCIKKGV